MIPVVVAKVTGDIISFNLICTWWWVQVRFRGLTLVFWKFVFKIPESIKDLKKKSIVENIYYTREGTEQQKVYVNHILH